MEQHCRLSWWYYPMGVSQLQVWCVCWPWHTVYVPSYTRTRLWPLSPVLVFLPLRGILGNRKGLHWSHSLETDTLAIVHIEIIWSTISCFKMYIVYMFHVQWHIYSIIISEYFNINHTAHLYSWYGCIMHV